MSAAQGYAPSSANQPPIPGHGYQPTQPAQQKFTSQIAQPLQHAAPSAATAQLSGALAGSPSWMTPSVVHTPLQLPANLPGIQHPAIQNPGLSGSILNGSKPVNIAQTMAPTPKPAPQPVAQPTPAPVIRNPLVPAPQPGSPLNGITNGYRQVTQPQPITHLAPNPQQGTTNPPPIFSGGGMTALAPGNFPAQPNPQQGTMTPFSITAPVQSQPPAAGGYTYSNGANGQGFYDSNGHFLGQNAPGSENLSTQLGEYTANPARAY